MTPEDAIRIVGMLGRQLDKDDRYGWRDKKALVMVAASSGDWAAASALADALDLDEQQQESIYLDTRPRRIEN